MLNTPILFIVFNRVDTTNQVFEAIRKARPKQLFVAADGPRLGKEGEELKCKVVRKIATNVDWDCEVKTLFVSQNKGCGRGPADAITWFFKHVEQGIILEDDCLPDPTFFIFCEELLEKYKNYPQILMISGFNQFKNFSSQKEDYFFTRWGGIWGWATWRRAWKVYNYEVPEWHTPQIREQVLKSLGSELHQRDMQNHLDSISPYSQVNFWDFQWWFYRLLQKGIGIVPKHTLITNIGFGSQATHTFDTDNPLSSVIAKSLTFPLVHPRVIEESKEFEKHVLKYSIPNQTLKIRYNNLINKIKGKLSFSLIKF